MRLPEIEHGDTLRTKALIRIISLALGARLPDAARVALYHKNFAGTALGAWTHHTMRGPSQWTIAERELMAAMVATWNTCPFCIGAHHAIATLGMDNTTTQACLDNYHTAPISEQLRATLTFLETMTTHPDQLTATHAQQAMKTGVTPQQLTEAAAVAAIFNIITRYANALDFAIPTPTEYTKAASMMLKRGYA